MKIKKVKNQPKQITKYPEIDPKEQDAVESVNEIFKTPLMQLAAMVIPVQMIW